MKRIILSTLFLAALPFSVLAQGFARGADISWYTEMEKDGKHFYNTAGQQTEINALMKECGMNAIRLRVWVDPVFGGQGSCPFASGWCGTDDTVQKALAAKAQGMDVLIDFHYSDFFADPSRQAIPTAWQGSTLDELAQHVADHTTAVLTALKEAGVTPKWVQLGNETRNGMLYSKYNASKKDWENAGGATGSTNANYGGGWANYAKLSNAGYDAAKAVFPDVVCMSHLDTRGSDEDLSWWFTAFKNAGGKLDMVGLSHYPMYWNNGGEATATTTGKSRNEGLMKVIVNTFKTVQVPVMIVETGVYCEYVNGGKEVMQDLFDKCRARNYIKGVFYWEPEQYNWWKPAVYNTIGWNNYNMCGFLNNGRPAAILDPWQPTDAEREQEAGISTVRPDAPTSTAYDLLGRRLAQPTHGVSIKDGRKVLR
ncbi:MAG: glycosyl hydrolase 53 family protein [Bacteroidales bacterium]|nr:glycosyl hydrolase 53 family protein [Bacteroidales bacterium]